MTSFYDKSKIQELPQIIDWNAVKSNYWGGQENLNLKRKKQAEFLIKEDILPELIIGFGCFNEQAKETLLGFNVPEDKIKIIPQGYY